MYFWLADKQGFIRIPILSNQSLWILFTNNQYLNLNYYLTVLSVSIQSVGCHFKFSSLHASLFVLLPQTGGKPKKERREKKEQARKWYLAALPSCRVAWKVRNSREATNFKFCKPCERRKCSRFTSPLSHSCKLRMKNQYHNETFLCVLDPCINPKMSLLMRHSYIIN